MTLEAVRNYWNRSPCNSRRSQARLGSEDWAWDVTCNKLTVEPHLLEFLRPEEWQGKHVLDAGCGVGITTALLARNGAQVTACDLSAESLGLAVKLCGHLVPACDIAWHLHDLEQPWPYAHWDCYDLIFSFGVLHHTPDPALALCNLHGLLHREGELRIMLYHQMVDQGAGPGAFPSLALAQTRLRCYRGQGLRGPGGLPDHAYLYPRLGQKTIGGSGFPGHPQRDRAHLPLGHRALQVWALRQALVLAAGTRAALSLAGRETGMALADLGEADLNLSLKDLQHKLDNYGKFLIEIWAVDRPTWGDRLRQLCAPWTAPAATGTAGARVYPGNYVGVRLITIDNRAKERPEVRLLRPIFSLTGGIWLKFTDGSLEKLKEET